ncbi:hypothetical protein, partial [Rhodopirellula bahusiensis]|uniref:hypothetical protein n=1 Tax=Rhodopirellula bahusiensis TaxID=2014065 RepID=UPI003263023A
NAEQQQHSENGDSIHKSFSLGGQAKHRCPKTVSYRIVIAAISIFCFLEQTHQENATGEWEFPPAARPLRYRDRPI